MILGQTLVAKVSSEADPEETDDVPTVLPDENPDSDDESDEDDKALTSEIGINFSDNASGAGILGVLLLLALI